MKLKKFGPPGDTRPLRPPLDPPLVCVCCVCVLCVCVCVCVCVWMARSGEGDRGMGGCQICFLNFLKIFNI